MSNVIPICHTIKFNLSFLGACELSNVCQPVCKSVRLSACISAAPTVWIFVKFYIGKFN
jgi:hypothetical protein